MKEQIEELGSLCKLAAELERKWDRAGGDYLGTRMSGGDYTKIVEEYLASVRRLETALCNHLVAVTFEVAEQKKKALKRVGDTGNPPKPALPVLKSGENTGPDTDSQL